MPTVLVTGSNGQLGSELKAASQNYYGYDFIFTDIDTLDITNKEKTHEYIKNAHPDWILNCAAYNLVDKAESESDIAMLINGNAVRYIAEAIKESECKLIHISSDYVFDGKSNVPYDESAPANPVSAYGRSKLAGENFALLHNHSMIIRTAWLYSSYGNNFVKTILKHGKVKESLNVVFDQTGTPTYAGDLAESVLHIISGVIRNHFAFNAGKYHYSNEGVCSWYDLANEVIQEAGLECKINPILSKDFPSTAKRPSYSVLDKSKIKENYLISIPHWRSSLRKCMKLMK
jgi:dTDP-4-dehydrorhamnose reductase